MAYLVGQASRIIALAGAGCVGKTTVLEQLRTEFEEDDRVGLVDEAAKRYFAVHKVPDAERFTAGTQGEIQGIALAGEQSACGHSRVVVVDRSVLDYAVYVGAIGDSDGEAALFAKVQSWVAERYMRIFLLDPAGVPFENTAERREDEETRGHLHEAFLSFFVRRGIGFTVLGGTVQARKDAVGVAVRTALNG